MNRFKHMYFFFCFLSFVLPKIKCFFFFVLFCNEYVKIYSWTSQDAPRFPVFPFIHRSSVAVRRQWLSPSPCTLSLHLEIGNTKTAKVGRRSTRALVHVSKTPYKYRSNSAFFGQPEMDEVSPV